MSIQDMAPARVPKILPTSSPATEAEAAEVRKRMRGFFERLSPEQEHKVLAYQGNDRVLDPEPTDR